MTKTKTEAHEGFGDFKFGPRAPTACRPLLQTNEGTFINKNAIYPQRNIL